MPVFHLLCNILKSNYTVNDCLWSLVIRSDFWKLNLSTIDITETFFFKKESFYQIIAPTLYFYSMETDFFYSNQN